MRHARRALPRSSGARASRSTRRWRRPAAAHRRCGGARSARCPRRRVRRSRSRAGGATTSRTSGPGSSAKVLRRSRPLSGCLTTISGRSWPCQISGVLTIKESTGSYAAKQLAPDRRAGRNMRIDNAKVARCELPDALPCRAPRKQPGTHLGYDGRQLVVDFIRSYRSGRQHQSDDGVAARQRVQHTVDGVAVRGRIEHEVGARRSRWPSRRAARDRMPAAPARRYRATGDARPAA